MWTYTAALTPSFNPCCHHFQEVLTGFTEHTGVTYSEKVISSDVSRDQNDLFCLTTTESSLWFHVAAKQNETFSD